ncbi:UPF0280 family protein [Desulfobotulus sp. H1]|uniref:UPF0280 family protein n=1 Tax=Desulfobotulus pelophilus TaxID=2823377 RepID=A0ABT3NB61_9BACT|nr:UPF0280 family protein [Desulfobotulus pelophilus]MCW7754709.1 UPF0280 family protein [Desulfobotulus pelophilus]
MHDPFSSRNRYRSTMGHAGLVGFRLTEQETDLHIQAVSDLSVAARKTLLRLRQEIREYISSYPEFSTNLTPWNENPGTSTLIQSMANASRLAEVGPMASVAGAIAEAVGRKLLRRSSRIIVENGGDLFACSDLPLTIGLYAGDTPFSGKIAMQIPPPVDGMGICTSSGTLGHSISFGRADAAVVMGPDTALADALATSMANQIHKPEDIDTLIKKAAERQGITAMVLVKGDRLAAYGKVKLLRMGS